MLRLILCALTLLVVPGLSLSAASEQALTLTGQLSHAYLLDGSTEDVYLCLTLTGSEPERVRRLGMNLALVIDRSGSMASEDKLEYAKAAAEQLVDRLRPDDRLAIVAYDDRIQTLIRSTPVRERHLFRQAIRSLHSGNSTNLCGGMMAGFEEVLGHFDGERLNRVLLISDGLANVGVTDSHSIGQRARQCRQQGVRISTMGVGVDYDEVLMSNISEQSGGKYHYINHPEAIGRHLEKELDELSRVIATNLVVTVELGDGVELLDVYGYVHDRCGSSLTIPVSDMFSGERRKIVLRLRVPPSSLPQRRIASTLIRFQDAGTNQQRVTRTPVLSMAYTRDVECVKRNRSLEVLTKVEIVHNAETVLTAMRHQKEGRFDVALELLTDRYLASMELNDTEYHSEEVARHLKHMQQVAREITQTKVDPTARRDLQLRTQLKQLGYISGN